MTLFLVIAGIVAGGGAGFYAHYKWGAKLAKDAAVIRTAVSDIKK